ncbi:LOB domain-containing protein 1-like [Impatiens glandulifera]|uniref:LOB domain-containing protein 1-like n=1 Tax=Impatiens glandulifera TaxID=253017 RepID=UPI001FB12877|nr:LOB domain-containing protein 1-like [Impatiens glandulifera]
MDMDMGESSDNTTTTTLSNSSSAPNNSPSNSPPPTPLVTVVSSPCAACKILRRRCAEKCVLAPYFPPTDPLKFTTAHRVFGASNIIKFLQELPESQRADAVSSMVYEANARLRDPVYGCAGAICHLQKQVNELQAQLAKAQAEVVNMQCQQTNLLTLLCMEMAPSQHPSSNQQQPMSLHDNYMMNINVNPYTNLNSPSQINFQPNSICLDDINLSSFWAEPEPLWT